MQENKGESTRKIKKEFADIKSELQKESLEVEA